MKKYFISGIGTEIGKTIMSALVCEKLKADYWKPIQAGELDFSDTHKVTKYTSYDIHTFPEKHALKTPMSPHAAAEIEGVKIQLSDFSLPKTENNLVIEGAGGLMVPINHEGDMIIDLIKHLNLPLILVSRNYLGSINHTLMSIAMAQKYGIEIEGIIFNGPENKTTESFILKHTGIRCIGKINDFDLSPENFKAQSNLLAL